MKNKVLPIVSVLIMLTSIVIYLYLLSNDYAEQQTLEAFEEKKALALLQENQFSTVTNLDTLKNNIANPNLDAETNAQIANMLCGQCYIDTTFCMPALMQVNFILSADTANIAAKKLKKSIYKALGDTLSTP